MNLLIQTIIYLVAIIGIIAVIGSFFEIFKNSNLEYFTSISNKIFDFKKEDINTDKTIRIDIYLNNMSDLESAEIKKIIENDKYLNDMADYINIYKTFDKK